MPLTSVGYSKFQAPWVGPLSATFVSSNQFTVAGDQTSTFVTGRRVKCNCGSDGYKYGTISSSSFTSPQTTITLISGLVNLTSNLKSVEWGVEAPIAVPYGPIMYNDIGHPGEMGFGVGICPPDILALIPGMTGLFGHKERGHANYGNYQYSDGSIMCWIPRCYYKVGTGSNGLAVNLFDIKSIHDFPDTEIAITGMTRANPCVVTAVAHGRSNGDYIWISHITEQSEWKSLSGKIYKVANKTDDTFELTDTSDVNIDTSTFANDFVAATDPNAKIIYNEAMANGYAWFRADIDGGKIQAGQFVDKYMSSMNAKGIGYVASSIKNGLPISISSSHNPIADLTACAGNYYYESINAAHGRDGVNGYINPDSIFFEMSRFVQAKLAFLSRAHGDASSSVANCAWYNATYNYPKGCNNNALRDTDDSTVLYESDGYSNCGKTGSGELFAKTTHNGQDCGVADVNGLMWEINLGVTCIASTAAIEAISSATTPVFTWTGHGLSVGDYVLISGITQADWVNFKDKIWKVATVPNVNTFTLETAPDTSGYAAYDAGTDPGTFTKGTFHVAKPETAMKDFTAGNSSSTDHWGATGVASMMEEFMPAFETAYAVNRFSQRFGSGGNQVLSEALFGVSWLLAGLGFPKDKDGIDLTGVNVFGRDYFYQYIKNELCLLSCGAWSYGAGAGVWSVSWAHYRALSSSHVSLRLACFPE